MTRLEISFNEIFKDKGGIHRSEFSKMPIVKDLLKYARAEIIVLRKAEKNIPPIYVDLINDYTLNAAAAKQGNQYFIGINIGAILHTFSIFSRMLSSNTILRNIGNADLEGPPRKIYDAQLKEASRSLSFYTRDIIPQDPVRKATSTIFMKHVLDFLLFHEYAHIVYGHLDYCLSNADKNGSGLDPLILQALEVSADSFATFTSLKFINGMNMEENPIFRQELKHLYKGHNQALRMWLFPIYTYFRLFGFANARHSITTDNYPTPACRANLIFENVHSYWDYTYDPIDIDALLELCTKIIFEVEKAFDQISDQGLDTRALLTSLSDEHFNHMKELMNKEQDIYETELLKEYSFIPRYE